MSILFAALVLISCNNPSKPVVKQEPKKDSVIPKSFTKAQKDSIIKDSIKSAKMEKAYKESFVLKNYIVSSAPDNDVQKLDSDAVVFLYPDSVQVENMKKEDGEDNFYIGADDAQYYQGQAIEMCDSIKMKHISPEKRYIQFISKAGTIYFDTRAKAARGWMTMFFRTDSLPRIVSVFDAISDSTLKAYFKRK